MVMLRGTLDALREERKMYEELRQKYNNKIMEH